MPSQSKTAFIAYCRDDTDFALKLANDLRDPDVEVWIDLRRDGEDFYHAVKEAQRSSCCVLAILSPAAHKSDQFRRQISFAVDQRTNIIPVIRQACEPMSFFILDPPVDLTADYKRGLKELLRRMGVPERTPEEDRQRAQQIYAEIAEHARTHAAERAKIQDGLMPAILGASTGGQPAADPESNTDPVPHPGILGALRPYMEDQKSAFEAVMPIPPPNPGFVGYNVPEPPIAFVCYSRQDAAFVRKLAENLKTSGARVWMDELDIRPGQKWSRAIQDALNNCPRMLLVLSPASVESDEVEAEYNFALEKKKEIVPVLIGDCEIPFRLRPFQRADFTGDYQPALERLLDTLLGR